MLLFPHHMHRVLLPPNLFPLRRLGLVEVSELISRTVLTIYQDLFRAVSVIAGAQLSGCDGGTTPVPYLGIHGTQDNVLAIQNGRGLRDRFLTNNKCQSKNAPEPSGGSQQAIKTVYTCEAAPVWWIAHAGGHVGDPRSNGQEFAPKETWDFFNLAAQSGA